MFSVILQTLQKINNLYKKITSLNFPVSVSKNNVHFIRFFKLGTMKFNPFILEGKVLTILQNSHSKVDTTFYNIEIKINLKYLFQKNIYIYTLNIVVKTKFWVKIESKLIELSDPICVAKYLSTLYNPHSLYLGCLTHNYISRYLPNRNKKSQITVISDHSKTVKINIQSVSLIQ
ncbi:hypothetical protein AGLY_009348 [Aphis glycines]|uniref:Uncharacterized protein n=1 Tax=Aphis glycines TaxID=307491 RepID=A0A6G0TJF3_APHGL|nr:hypothetical protein AGLY_009348 [Aphis glycines]